MQRGHRADRDHGAGEDLAGPSAANRTSKIGVAFSATVGGRDDGVGDGERGVEHVADDESDRGASDPDPWLGHPWEGCREREDAL